MSDDPPRYWQLNDKESLDEREKSLAFALTCQIPQFLNLPGDIQRGLVDVMARMGCNCFGAMLYMKEYIDAGNLGMVKQYLIELNQK